MTSVSSPSGGSVIATYNYNAVGQRVQASGSSIGSYPVFQYYDAFGNLGYHGDLTTWGYAPFPPVNGKVYGKYYGLPLFLHTNPLGSTGTTTRPDGSWVSSEIYDPWGQRWATSGTLLDERFAGIDNVRDPESGLDQTPNRMFASQYGRWLSPDPLAGDVSNPQSLNRYAYVLNNPINLVDPTGLCSATAMALDPGAPCFDTTGVAGSNGGDGGDGPGSVLWDLLFGGGGGGRSFAPIVDNPFLVFRPGGRGGGGAPAPAKQPGSKGSGCGLQRVALAAKGALNLVVADTKVGLAAISLLAVPATSGVSGATIAYGAIGAAGNGAAGGIQLIGAATGQVKLASQGANAVSTVTTVFGLGTLIATGDMEKASLAATFESFGTTGFNGGATGNLIDEAATFTQKLLLSTETGQSVLDALGLGGTGACIE